MAITCLMVNVGFWGFGPEIARKAKAVKLGAKALIKNLSSLLEVLKLCYKSW